MNLSLRAKLTLWFGLVMAISLVIFGALNYRSISTQLTTGLDVALNNAVRALDVKFKKIVEESQMTPWEAQRKFIASRKDTGQPEIEYVREIDSTRDVDSVAPSIQPLPSEEDVASPGSPQKKGDNVWASITEYVVLNPRNFMVQIMDSSGQVAYRSTSMGPDTLVLPDQFLASADTSEAKFGTFTRLVHNQENKESQQQLRVAIAKSQSALLVVAYPLDELQSSLDDFLQTLTLLIPVILLVSLFGGWFFARKSLQPVDQITQIAKDITASNLSRRIPVSKSNDELRRLSETLNDMISRLESSFGRIRQFTADASHELRTPLTILTGELELALRSARTEKEYQEVISSALQETLRMSRVVEDLLLLSRADMGRVRLAKSKVNLNEMLADLADSTTILGAEKDHVITYRHSDEELIVDGDHARLYQMFLNLLDNAVKYTPQGGSVSLSLHREGDYAEIRVRDTGIGISPEDQKKIFDRFYRVDKARSRAQGGVGLGLAIVEWTVRAHDGQIDVESDPGRGSTFVVRIPLASDQNSDGDGAAPVAEEKAHGIAGALDHLPKFLKRRPSERHGSGSGGNGREEDAEVEREDKPD